MIQEHDVVLVLLDEIVAIGDGRPIDRSLRWR